MIHNVNDPSYDEIAEAKHQGYNFMKIYLHRDRVGRNQKQIIISGAISLKGSKISGDSYGSSNWTFKEVRGDSMIFNYDPNERDYVCWLYDDPGSGYFSSTGYNRDLLASHYKENFFVIKDPDLNADIALRSEHIEKHGSKKLTKKKQSKGINSLEDIENQIKYLEDRKNSLMKTEKIKEAEKAKKLAALEKARAAKATKHKLKEAVKLEV